MNYEFAIYTVRILFDLNENDVGSRVSLRGKIFVIDAVRPDGHTVDVHPIKLWERFWIPIDRQIRKIASHYRLAAKTA